jgi:hypothetical protein
VGPRIGFRRPTVKRLTEVWQRALRRGDRRVVRRVTALLLLAEQVPCIGYFVHPCRTGRIMALGAARNGSGWAK